MGYQNRQPPEGINYVSNGWQKDFVLLVVGFFAGLALLIWLAMLALGWSARWIPFSWEQALSRPLQQTVEPDQRLRYLQGLADDLARAGNLKKPMTITVHHQDSDVVNAYASLGGHVFILEGLLDEVKTEQGLAFVLAHEIAHVHHRHPLKATIRQLGFGVMMGLVFGNTDIAQLAGAGGQIAMLNYSRDLEREADAWALAALQKHYGHVDGADALFQWLAEEKADEAPPQWLSSHPDVQARIERLRDISREQGYSLQGKVTPLPEWETASSEAAPPTDR
ncbi:M48 family metallopeptidase [Marinimicrobium agarilyticum]|uniref:M48 family metallopeptidase n=1 Tax=Marinimicrobium agarilyticum TaxID=306546 RepID=UPI0004254142|nr:M48 family metallopeptidase [Marinimicrobium agarilyticum]